jgi:DNA-binding response OmpR family regulator
VGFKIYLPRVEDLVPSDDPEAVAFPVSGHETILLGEDEDAVRESAAEYLAQNGYRVLKAGLGSEALEIAEAHQEPIHLLLTDLVMPRMSGKELSDRIAGIHSETKVVFMSGYSNNLLTHQQLLDSKHVLLCKPFRLATLGRRIRETLGQSSTASASPEPRAGQSLSASTVVAQEPLFLASIGSTTRAERGVVFVA